MTSHLLPGLRPEPLGSYLAGLGLIRLVGGQADPAMTAAWAGDRLVIDTSVADLAAWLANEYAPTPLLSPWNEGSGFGAKDKEPRRRLTELRERTTGRLAGFGDAIRLAEEIATRSRAGNWDKKQTVQEFRNRCPEALLPWIDAAVVLADAQALFPPLLGTGGNDGRLDFSTNFHQALLDLLDESARGRERSLTWARDVLTGTPGERLAKAPVGQFDPAAAGGPASSPFGAADSVVNPWEYVLLTEGALLFASGAVRRHQHAAGRAAIPFTVRASPDGFASGAAGEARNSRGELWAPLWTQPCTLAEIRQLFGEARASWNGRPAQQAVDFYAATRTLGVARGVGEFVRYGLHQRNGLAFVAVPEDRVRVDDCPEVRLVAQLEEWVSQIRVTDESSAVGGARRRFERTHLGYVRNARSDASGRRETGVLLGRLLAELTGLEQAVGRSGRARKDVPVRRVPSGADFLRVLAAAECPALRIAVGIASCATRRGTQPSRSVRQILLPVDPRDQERRVAQWRDAPVVPGLGVRPLRLVLADVLAWRSRTATDEPGSEAFHGVPTFRVGIRVPAADLHDYAAGLVPDADVAFWLRACLALGWDHVAWDWAEERPFLPVATLGMLHPLAAGLVLDHPDAGEPAPPADEAGAAGDMGEQTVMAMRPDWAIRLTAGQVAAVHAEAAARLRQAGWKALPVPGASSPHGLAIAAALVPRCRDARGVMARCGLAFRAESASTRELRSAAQEEAAHRAYPVTTHSVS